MNRKFIALALILMISVHSCLSASTSKCTTSDSATNYIINYTYNSSTSPTTLSFVNVLVGSSGDEYYFVQNSVPNSIYITRRDTSFTSKWETSFSLTLSANSPAINSQETKLYFMITYPGSNSIVEISTSTGSVTKTMNTSTFNNPNDYCTMAVTSDGLYVFFTAYINTGTTPLICRAKLSDSTGACLSGFDSNDSLNPREFALISDSEIYLSITAISGSTMSGLKYRINFSAGTAKWKCTFISTTSNDIQDLSSSLYSSSTNSIYSLTLFSVSNNVVLFVLNADNGSPTSSPYKFTIQITKASGIVLVNSYLYFVIVGSLNSYLVIFNTSSQSFTTYAFNSFITINKINLSLDIRLILIGKYRTYAYRSKVMTTQLSYDSFIISNELTMSDASSQYSITTQSSAQTLTSTSISFTSLACSASSVSLTQVSSLNSDISFSCDSVSALTLVPEVINTVSLSLSCSISDSISISYQLQKNPPWVTLDAANRAIIANTTGLPVDTNATLTIKSISTYPICDKTVNLLIVSCAVDNCDLCSSNNPNSCQTCADGYVTSGNASNSICVEYSSSLDSVSNILAIITLSIVGIAIIICIVSAFWDLCTIQGIWIIIYQMQYILLLLLTNSRIPKSIRDYLSGLNAVTCSLNFIPFKNIPGLKSLFDWFSLSLANSNLSYFGMNSGSSFKNLFSLICFICLLIPFHMLFIILRTKHSNNPKVIKIKEILFQIFTLSIYLRLALLTGQYIILSSFSEISSSKAISSNETISLIFAFTIAVFCIGFTLTSFVHWMRNRYIENTEHHMPLKEFFSGIKDEASARLYSTLMQVRQTSIAIFLAVCSSFSSAVIISFIIIGQFIYLVILLSVRPYKSVKDNVMEIIREVLYFVMVVLLIKYNYPSKWIFSAEVAYFCLILSSIFITVFIILGGIGINLILKIKWSRKASKISEDAASLPNSINLRKFEVNMSESMNKEAQDKNSKFDNSEIASDIQVNSPIPYQNNKETINSKNNENAIINLKSQQEKYMINNNSFNIFEENKVKE